MQNRYIICGAKALIYWESDCAMIIRQPPLLFKERAVIMILKEFVSRLETRITMNRNDKLLIAGMLLAAALFFAFFGTWSRETGSTAVIIVDGETMDTVPLTKDGDYSVEGLLGESIIRIRDGAVTMEQAPCPDQICVKHSRIRYSGEQIVCLPGRIIIEIQGGTQTQTNGEPVIDGVAK